jgi:peptidoglycan/xylan/chitin deacetylase (PgdA/CDA1 family)
MQREHDEEHILGLHSGTERGHLNHIAMTPGELNVSLQSGIADLSRITGREPHFVRPPYWKFSPETLKQYEAKQLHMLLTDLKIYDGLNTGILVSLNIRSTIRSELIKVRRKLVEGGFPVRRRCYPGYRHLS